MTATQPAALPQPGHAPSEPVELLLFRLGAKTFALPMGQVQYIMPLPGDFDHGGQQGQHGARHVVFDDQPVTYLSLWERFGENSLYAEYEALQALLPQRRQDHLDWMNALESSIHSGEPFTKARDPRQCAFGKWYYASQFNDRRLTLLLGQFDTPHAHIHSLADKLLGLAETGGKEEALRRFNEERHTTLDLLLNLFDKAQSLVIELQRRIAIIVSEDENLCALGADAVRDIISLPAERLSYQHNASGTLAGLAILDTQEVVPLLDWHRL
jgi:chemotaxis signal transduction protein